MTAISVVTETHFLGKKMQDTSKWIIRREMELCEWVYDV
jgi:hypothetical protein